MRSSITPVSVDVLVSKARSLLQERNQLEEEYDQVEDDLVHVRQQISKLQFIELELVQKKERIDRMMQDLEDQVEVLKQQRNMLDESFVEPASIRKDQNNSVPKHQKSENRFPSFRDQMQEKQLATQLMKEDENHVTEREYTKIEKKENGFSNTTPTMSPSMSSNEWEPGDHLSASEQKEEQRLLRILSKKPGDSVKKKGSFRAPERPKSYEIFSSAPKEKKIEVVNSYYEKPEIVDLEPVDAAPIPQPTSHKKDYSFQEEILREGARVQEQMHQRTASELSENADASETKEVELVWPHEWEIHSQVWIAGDFTQWRTIPMHRIDSHEFKITVSLPKGIHLYRFCVNGEWKHDKTKPSAINSSGHLCNRVKIT